MVVGDCLNRVVGMEVRQELPSGGGGGITSEGGELQIQSLQEVADGER